MRHIFILSLLLVSSSGCQYQIALGVEQMTGTIPVILLDNVISNLLRIKDDPEAIIGQIALKQSVSAAQNGLAYGASPNIAFRALAITGLTANVTNSLSYNWSVDPVNGSIDIVRLQLLFQHALAARDTSNKSSLIRLLALAGYLQKTDKASEAQQRDVLEAIMMTYPPLPNKGFVEIDTQGCQPPKDLMIKTGLYEPHTVCFKATPLREGAPLVQGRTLASRLVLWSILIPELSQAVKQIGSSNGGNSILTVPANQSPDR